nr:hypothetical protein 6 [bacterium]
MIITKPGETLNEDYHASEGMSASNIVDYLVSPKYARYRQLNAKDEPASHALAEGSVYHALLESEVNGIEPTVVGFDPPMGRTGKPMGPTSEGYKTAMENAKEANPDKLITDKATLDNCVKMIQELKTDFEIQRIFDIGSAEISVWLDYQGARFKYRPDVLTDRRIIDWKKTTLGKPHPDEWRREVEKYHYDVKAAFYQFFEFHRTGKWKRFFWVVQENEPPYDFNIIDASPYAFDIDVAGMVTPNIGARIAMRLIDQHCYCIEQNEWPGYKVFSQPDFKGRRIAVSTPSGYYQNRLIDFHN